MQQDFPILETLLETNFVHTRFCCPYTYESEGHRTDHIDVHSSKEKAAVLLQN